MTRGTGGASCSDRAELVPEDADDGLDADRLRARRILAGVVDVAAEERGQRRGARGVGRRCHARDVRHRHVHGGAREEAVEGGARDRLPRHLPAAELVRAGDLLRHEQVEGDEDHLVDERDRREHGADDRARDRVPLDDGLDGVVQRLPLSLRGFRIGATAASAATTVEPLLATAAAPGPMRPRAPRTIATALGTTTMPSPRRTCRMARSPASKAAISFSRPPSRRTTSAVSSATSVEPWSEIPTSASASAGASLMPSPTTATTLPARFSSFT